MKLWFKSGAPWIWLNAAAVSTSLIMIIGVLGLDYCAWGRSFLASSGDPVQLSGRR